MLQGFTIKEEEIARLPPEARDRIYKGLRELDYKLENDPLSLYFPHGKQRIFHRFRTPVRCFFGGNQSGKTTCGLADDLIQALDAEDLPEHLRRYKTFEPPFLCRIMAPSFPVLETTLYQKLQEMIPPHTLVGGSWSRAFDKNTRVLHFANGSKFFFQTYEMDVAKMGGATLDRVHYDEEPPLAARNECRLRVMARGGDEIFTMTPVEGLTWTYNMFWQERGIPRADETVFLSPDVSIVVVDMDDNPALGENQKRLALQGLSSEERQARKEGKFVALHGLIYQEFRTEEHVIPELGPDDLPSNVNVVVGIDPGIRNKCAVVWGFLSRDDDLTIFQEGYFEGYSVRQVAEAIHAINALYEIAPLYYVIDPAARNKAHQTGRSDQMEYADHGIITIAGQNSVTAGINRIKERFESKRIHVTDNCSHLIDELQTYRWKQPPRSGEDGAQKPVKKDDHLMDALRYLVASRPYLPEDLPPDNETELEKVMREDREGTHENEAMTEFGSLVM